MKTKNGVSSPAAEFIGIEIGGTKLQLVVGCGNQIVERRFFFVDESRSGKKQTISRYTVAEPVSAEDIRGQISIALKELLQKHRPKAVGVGFGGPVDWQTGRILDSHQIPGWADFPLGEWLAAETGLPVQIDNDANVAACAESLYGAGAGAKSVFYVTLGSGIGGGLAVDGRIFHGASGGEAEIGQIRISRDGLTVESLCSGWALDKRIRNERAKHPESLLFKLIESATKGEARHLASAWERHDPLAVELINETGQNLAFGLSHLVHLMHPEVIVLGGGLSLVGAPLRDAVAEALPCFLMPAFRPGPRIELSSLKEDAVPVGALLLAQDIYSNAIKSEPVQKSKSKDKILKPWIETYLKDHKAAIDSIPVQTVARLIDTFRTAWIEDRQIFVFGNGGSAANASHFATDLGKGASDKLGRPFRVMSLNDNTSWMTALGNDYSYEDVFVRQLMNYARPGDIAFVMSVSGSSPNLVKALNWAKERGLITIAMVGEKRGILAEIADHLLVIEDGHYGRAEDAHMTMSHMLCYAFIEQVAV